jgi:pyruvate formate lyase activating enzyme
MNTLQNTLDQLTAPGSLYVDETEKGALRCLACGHRCLIRPGKRGICQVRFNQDGELRVPYGYVAALHPDPIEKKPFNHVLPGCTALTFGMLGCDFHCGFCQNWVTSQALREPASEESINYIQRISPEQIVTYARRTGAEVIASSYNEPLITTEWAIAIFKQAKQAGLRCAYVSNGNATDEALDALFPYLSAYKIDLKTMQDKHYRQCGGVLQHVLDTIQRVHSLGLWTEVVTLVIPGFNDSNDELWEAARFITSVSPDIPWHVTAFHPDFKMDDVSATPAATLQRAAEIGQEAGLHYVYAGNTPGRVGSLEDTHCPACSTRLIHRYGYTILENRITAQGACPKCGTVVPGVWN